MAYLDSLPQLVLETMNKDMSERVEQLEHRLRIAKQIKEINTFFSEARCPVCGSRSIETNISIKGSEAMCYGKASVRCSKCGMFSYNRDINGYDAYHWNYDGSSELSMLEELKMATIRYLKTTVY